jgi:ATP-dependent helicase/nuclease subunit B
MARGNKKGDIMGELQFILGETGCGKSEYIDRRIVDEAYANPGTDYLFLTPEQASLGIQRKLAGMHKKGGFFNIEVFGFNRLAYTVFDELNIRVDGVLDDYGKSMLIRHIAGNVREQLIYYKGSIDKNGFIDQVKSFMSELYQYDVSREDIRRLTQRLESEGKDKLLADKLKDLLLIFEEFDRYMEENSMIVAEQTMELLVKNIGRSRRLRNTVVVMDGFTGFTPIQLNVLRQLIPLAKKTYAVITIGRENYVRENIAEHELFALSHKTIQSLKRLADETHTVIADDIWPEGADSLIHKRWTSDEFTHLERNIFRYPYKRYSAVPENISISAFKSDLEEMNALAAAIRRLVNEFGYRYRDIAVVSGNLERTVELSDRVFPRYDIAYFNDYNRPVKSNGIVDGITALLSMAEQNMSYESVMTFLKTGIIHEKLLDYDEIEKLENYILKHGIHGMKQWMNQWPAGEPEDIRSTVMEYVGEFIQTGSRGKHTVQEYVHWLQDFLEGDDLDVKNRLEERIYNALELICDKLLTIMGAEMADIHEFRQMLELGIKELSLGVVPSTLDTVIVGDITRTRLPDVKIVFILGANVGVIPKVNDRKQIISDAERERFAEADIELAPGDVANDYMEQFYLYLSLTKASEKLFISYTGEENPSYIIGRLCNIFTRLSVRENTYMEGGGALSLRAASERLTGLINAKRTGVDTDDTELYALLKYYGENEDRVLSRLYEAFVYSNVPDKLDREVVEEIKERLLTVSASQLEMYAECAYAYYLKYILGLKEREIKTVNSMDFGTLIHNSLKSIYMSLSAKKEEHLKGFVWGDAGSIKYDDISGFSSSFTKLIYTAVDKAYMDMYSGFKPDEKFEFMKENVVRVATKAIGKLFVNHDGGDFVPTYFELPYTRTLDLENAGADKLSVTGRVDRVDVNEVKTQESGMEEFRVIDYKTGSKSFDLTEVYEGRQLQLIMYLSAVLEREKKRSGGMEIKPEGAYYYKMADAWVTGNKSSAADKKKEKEYELDGISASEDGEGLAAVMKFVDDKVTGLAEDILAGDISKLPYEADNGKQCEYCAFKADCRFDTVSGGNKTKRKRFNGTGKDVMAAVLDEMGVKREAEE